MPSNSSTRRLVATIFGLSLITACSGQASSSGRGGRTIDVTMSDNKFVPNDYSVRKGETVTFRFKNTGTTTHEAFIGSQAEQDRHHGEMTAGPGGTMNHAGTMNHGDAGGTSSTALPTHSHAPGVPDDHSHGSGAPGNEISVDPGQTGDLAYTFNDGGTFILGCHEPGHWESGMKAAVVVA